jgi:hypothetical protein
MAIHDNNFDSSLIESITVVFIQMFFQGDQIALNPTSFSADRGGVAISLIVIFTPRVPTMPPSMTTNDHNDDVSQVPSKSTHGTTSITTSRPMDTLTIGNRAGTLHMPSIPVFSSPLAERKWNLEHMAGAFRIFGKFGFSEGAAGHISLRDPVNPDWMWINPFGMHFGQIKKSDLVCVDEDGYVVDGLGAGRPVNTAGVHIHKELHKARPDIKAACHAHSIFGKTWSTFGKELEMINQGISLGF